MLYSKTFIPTLKEIPADAEVISHKLMLRAGMIRKLAAGIYSYLPLAQKVLKKTGNIIRREMDAIGAQELLLPSVQPAEIWQESGRWDIYGKELLRFKDRGNRDFCLGPTHEEVITDLVKREVRSYRQLPLVLYQIQTKFRDEIRPRFGIMRAREFLMKDAYSFDADEASAEESYHKMFQAYSQIFKKCGLEFRAVEADTGSIGGSFSHEFMVLAESGEDAIISCDSCGYAANQEKAEIRTSPINRFLTSTYKELKKVKTPERKTVEEVTEFLRVKKENLVKTMIFDTDSDPVVALVRGDHDINEVKLKNFLDCQWLALAEDSTVEKISGAPRGFAGPLGLKIKIFADSAVAKMVNFVVGGNEKDTHYVNANLERDFTVNLFADLRTAKDGDGCPRCHGILNVSRGIEVGHIFKLGTKYSESMKATYLDSGGKEKLIIMGCYGIGVGRTVAAAIEQNHDKDGIIFPLSIAPFQTIILPLNTDEKEIMDAAFSLYSSLQKRGIDVLLDDRPERAGTKFKDADLIGIPVRLTIGHKSLKERKVEIRLRKTGDSLKVKIEEAAREVETILGGD